MQHFLIVTDIFGQCEGLQQLLNALAAPGRHFTIIDPYQRLPQAFISEQLAYAAFVNACDHEQYAARVTAHLMATALPINVAIGFSAGASALWRALAAKHGFNCRIQQAVLFYPGQIYKYLDLMPKIPVEFIFGERESHFDVAELCLILSQKPEVNTVITPYKHGFMNPASAAFNQQGFTDFVGMLRNIDNESFSSLERLALMVVSRGKV